MLVKVYEKASTDPNDTEVVSIPICELLISLEFLPRRGDFVQLQLSDQYSIGRAVDFIRWSYDKDGTYKSVAIILA